MPCSVKGKNAKKPCNCIMKIIFNNTNQRHEQRQNHVKMQMKHAQRQTQTIEYQCGEAGF